MKILELRIKGFQQFQNIKLDFTDKDGNPLNKICFIGRNGTGKSTILNILKELIVSHNMSDIKIAPFFYLKFKIDKNIFYYFSTSKFNFYFFFKSDIDNEGDWFNKVAICNTKDELHLLLKSFEKYAITFKNYINQIELDISLISEDLDKLINIISLKDDSTDLLIYSPPESRVNKYMQVISVPKTNLNEALSLMNSFPFYHIISDDKVSEFWKVLIYLIKKRENERDKYENLPENLNKTKKQLIKEFDEGNPKILDKLSILWNKILEPAGLIFDTETVKNPIQLSENLIAYIRLKSTNKIINYDQLSTGIRNFIFRVGHIYSLYFNREIKNGFLLLDEPENSLFPDFLFDLIETYQEIVIDKNGENNTQFFVSTHNPIIAAQFKPEERIILEWNKEGYVDAYKGVAPEGDDPNDILVKDFKLKHLMGREGQKVWNDYITLRKKLKKAKDKTEKDKLISEINRIGELYNFED